MKFHDLTASGPWPIRIILVLTIALGAGSIFIAINNDFLADMRACATVKLIKQLQHAVNLFYSDIGSYPMEYSDVPYEKYLAHNLFRPTGSSQWQGPYIKNPLRKEDSPFGATLRVYNYMDYANGFDLTCDGVIDTRGEGSFVVFWNVDANTAKRVNKRLEKKADGPQWQQQGRVKYSQERGTLSVYLAGG